MSKQSNDIASYQVTPNQDLMVVIYERVDSTGMRRTETAIVRAGAQMTDLRYIKDAFDAAFSLGVGGYSTIQVKQAHTVIVNPSEEGEEKP